MVMKYIIHHLIEEIDSLRVQNLIKVKVIWDDGVEYSNLI